MRVTQRVGTLVRVELAAQDVQRGREVAVAMDVIGAVTDVVRERTEQDAEGENDEPGEADAAGDVENRAGRHVGTRSPTYT